MNALTPEKTEPSADSDDNQSNNTYADDIFDDCGTTPKGPALEVRDEGDESSPDGAVIVLNYQQSGDQASPRNAKGRGSDEVPNPKKGFEQATPVLTATTPLEGTPFKEGDKGRIQTLEPNMAVNAIPTAAKEDENQEVKRVLKPRVITGNPKSESAFAKVPARRRQDKQKTALSELQMTQMQSSSVSGGIKKTQEQTNKILTNRRDRIAQNEQKHAFVEMKMAQQDKGCKPSPPKATEDDANISDSHSGNDHQVSQVSQAVKSKRSQVAQKSLGLSQ